MQNQSISSSYEALYSECRDVPVCWPLIGVAALFNAISVPGMAMNFAVVWVTWRTRSLRGTANFLLALYSLCELLAQSGNLFFLWTALCPDHFVDYSLSVRVHSFGLFGFFASNLAMALIALDRFVAVMVPLSYKRLKSAPYLAALAAVCGGYSLYMLSLVFQAALKAPARKLTGALAEAYQPDLFPRWFGFASLVFNLTSFALYLVVGLRVRLLNQDSNVHDHLQQRLAHTLFFIITFDVGGYFVAILCNMIVFPTLRLDSWLVYQCSGVLANISAASNAPILYWRSEDYRKAFRKEFARLKRFVGLQPPNVVLSSQQRHQPQNQTKNAVRVKSAQNRLAAVE